MSINDFINKIKGKLSIDTFTIMCLFVIVGVGVSAFGLGRLSITSKSNYDQDIIITDNNILLNSEIKKDIEIPNQNLKEKRYVASKNGKLYYTAGCSGSKRILIKNQIWFASSLDAEKSGYSLSSSCK